MLSLPIETYGLLVALFGLVAIGSGIWLVVHARDVARLADNPETDIVTGRARRSPATRGMTRVVLLVSVLATVAALGIFVLIATRAINSEDTRKDANAQRP